MRPPSADYEAGIAPVKRHLFSQLLSGLAAAGGSGSEAAEPLQLLELGVGTGPNLRYYADFYQAAAGAGAGEPAAAGADTRPAAAAGGSPGGAPAPAAAAAAGAAAAASSAALPPLHITGVDRNDYMRAYLQQNLEAAGWPAERFGWVAGDVAALPLGDASMDAVVCTLVSGFLWTRVWPLPPASCQDVWQRDPA